MPDGTEGRTFAFPALLEGVARRAAEAGVFRGVRVNAEATAVECDAEGPAAPASYRLFEEGGRLWVSLVTPDRWLSQSIEADLVHTGDKLEDLIEEELIDQGVEARLPVEHFRSEDLLFTFRSPIPAGAGSEAQRIAAACLLAYEACFRQLGDMETGEE